MIGNIKSKYIINYSITTLEPLAIGGSNERVLVGEVDRPIIKRINSNEPYIPGSSFRGTIRSFFDRVSSSIKQHIDSGYNNQLVFNFDHKSNGLDSEENVCDIAARRNEYQKDLSELIKESRICDLCLFFGAKGYGSPLTITDAYLDENIDNLEKRTHIKIDRDSDVTARGALFSTESVPSDTKFSGTIVFELRDLGDKNREDVQLLLLKILLNQINEKEIYLGGMKSSGYGKCMIQISDLYKMSVLDLIIGKDPNECLMDIDQCLTELDNLVSLQ